MGSGRHRVWTVDFVRKGGMHSICTVDTSKNMGEDFRRIVAAARELVLEETGEDRPLCPTPCS
jgi:hypothetical protein